MARSALPGSLMVSAMPALVAPMRRLQRAVAGVAGRDDHHDAGLDEPIDFDAQRALAAGEPFGLEVVAEAHVHAVNEQAAAVAVDLLDVRRSPRSYC